MDISALLSRDGDATINVVNLYEGDELRKAREEIKQIKREKGIDIRVDDYKELDQYQRT
ncbi:hypothetical protein [Desulfitobacterium hafniense]|uniref:hypothetical protein n=1 Tax=Desulfitobacterium hafniense TaxID=49338 RepID=UPI00130525EB|nr:hypothetical protein [Desulfitobacterium hafniense]